MKGGFVTRNCPRCNTPKTLPETAFMKLALWVACPECKARMRAKVLPDKNYGYFCEKCDIAIQLSELLPRYEDL
jgi:hypothetical protein